MIFFQFYSSTQSHHCLLFSGTLQEYELGSHKRAIPQMLLIYVADLESEFTASVSIVRFFFVGFELTGRVTFYLYVFLKMFVYCLSLCVCFIAIKENHQKSLIFKHFFKDESSAVVRREDSKTRGLICNCFQSVKITNYLQTSVNTF